jgi:hypothetical protein
MKRLNLQFIAEMMSTLPLREPDYLYIGTSQLPLAGKGLFTAIQIDPFEIIAIFRGRIINQTTMRMREQSKEDAFFINLPDGSTMDCKGVSSQTMLLEK